MRIPLLATLIFPIALTASSSRLSAQAQATVSGTIRSSTEDRHFIPGARIVLIQTSQNDSTKTPRTTTEIRRTRSTTSGSYTFQALPLSDYTLQVTALGYTMSEHKLRLTPGELHHLDISLSPTQTVAHTHAVTVTAQKPDTYIKPSPLKVQVITSQQLQRNVTSNLMDAVSAIPGLFQQIDCGVCYTNNIRINGMEGPYTAILIDSMPIVGALGSVYGLNGINPSLIDKLEIVKGPSSTIYGSEAMGGVINVVTTDVRYAPRFSIDVNGSSHGEQSIDVASSHRNRAFASLLSASYYNMSRFVDHNADNFSDLPIGHRFAMFGKFAYQTGDEIMSGLTVKLYDEDRFGGVSEWNQMHRGSDSIYGESIRTRRGELFGSQSLASIVRGATLQFSASTHHQDSYYGHTHFRATQTIGHLNLAVTRAINPQHRLLTGTTVRLNNYSDNTAAQSAQKQVIIPGLFAEDEYAVSSRLSLLAGARTDYHDVHGLIIAPRTAVKWNATPHTTMRVAAGTGFRVVELFTEDHAALTGSRRVVIEEALKPERSISIAANVNHVIEFGVNNMMIDFDAFHTKFSNKIVPDYNENPNEIIYRNLRGYAVSRGLSVAINQNFVRFPLLYSVAATVQDVYIASNNAREQEFFAPRFKGNITASYAFKSPAIMLDYTGIITGSMRLPEYASPFERLTQSPVHSVHSIQATYTVRQGFQLYSAIKNVLNFTQGSPLVNAQHPFSDSFDTNYVWGPIQGRYAVVGIRYSVGRSYETSR